MRKAVLFAFCLLCSFIAGCSISNETKTSEIPAPTIRNTPHDTLTQPSPSPQAAATELVIAVFPNGTGAETYLFRIADGQSNAFMGDRNMKRLVKDEDFLISSQTLATRGLNEKDISDLYGLIAEIDAFDETKMDEANMRKEMEAGKFLVTVLDGWDIEVITGNQILYFGYWGNQSEALDELASKLVQKLNGILVKDLDLHGWA